MSKYVCGGLGLTSIALSLQPFFTTLRPYWLYFFVGGVILFFIPIFQWGFRRFAAKAVKEKSPAILSPMPSDNKNFPPVKSLTAKDIEKDYGIGIDKLKQHIENGLVGYVKVSESQKRPLDKDRDLVKLEVWPEKADELIKQWLFKTEDIKKYIKTT